MEAGSFGSLLSFKIRTNESYAYHEPQKEVHTVDDYWPEGRSITPLKLRWEPFWNIIVAPMARERVFSTGLLAIRAL